MIVSIDNTNAFVIIYNSAYTIFKNISYELTSKESMKWDSFTEERFKFESTLMINILNCMNYLIIPSNLESKLTIPHRNYQIYGKSFPVHFIKYLLPISEVENPEYLDILKKIWKTIFESIEAFIGIDITYQHFWELLAFPFNYFYSM